MRDFYTNYIPDMTERYPQGERYPDERVKTPLDITFLQAINSDIKDAENGDYYTRVTVVRYNPYGSNEFIYESPDLQDVKTACKKYHSYRLTGGYWHDTDILYELLDEIAV